MNNDETIELNPGDSDDDSPRVSIQIQSRDPAYDLLQVEQFAVREQSGVEGQTQLREKFIAMKERKQVPLHEPAGIVLQIWRGLATEDKVMGRIASVVFGAAPTQVSVERSFSTLRWVLSDLRNRLGEDRLEEILLLKLNSNE